VGAWIRSVLVGLAALAMLCSLPAGGADTSVWLEAARREGSVVVYGTLDRHLAEPLVAAFEARHPGVRVEFHDMATAEAYERFRAESVAGPSADVVWSSAMDLQMKLVNDGYAQAHRSGETAALPSWAVWREEAYGTSFEPTALIYNTRLLAPGEVPSTHPELLRLLTQQRDRLAGKVGTYDPQRSGVGFLLQTQDEQANPVVFWSLARAMGAAGVVTLPNTADMLAKVASGEMLLAYNTLGAYSFSYARGDPRVGVKLLQDYTLVTSRVIFIARRARHPNAARLWVDFVLSRPGQELMAQHGTFFSVRDDMPGGSDAAELRSRLGAAARPIALGTGLLTYLDDMKQRNFLRQWNAVTGAP
jgi:iron(III) transport system substrate-binding protein